MSNFFFDVDVQIEKQIQRDSLSFMKVNFEYTIYFHYSHHLKHFITQFIFFMHIILRL